MKKRRFKKSCEQKLLLKRCNAFLVSCWQQLLQKLLILLTKVSIWLVKILSHLINIWQLIKRSQKFLCYGKQINKRRQSDQSEKKIVNFSILSATKKEKFKTIKKIYQITIILQNQWLTLKMETLSSESLSNR